MSASTEFEILAPDGAVDVKKLSDKILKLGAAGDAASLSSLLRTVAGHNTGDFDAAYSLFEPVFSLLDESFIFEFPFVSKPAPPGDFDPHAIVAEWASRLGLDSTEHLNAMLAMPQSVERTRWLLQAGVDPNSVADPSSSDKVTILGAICRGFYGANGDTMRAVLRAVLDRGEMPYWVAPAYDGDPGACDLLKAVITGEHMTGPRGAEANLKGDEPTRIAFAVIDTVTKAFDAGCLPLSVQHALGRLFLQSEHRDSYLGINLSRTNGYWPLSLARFENPDEWKVAFAHVSASGEISDLLQEMNPNKLPRLLHNMSQDGVGVDDVTAYITRDKIPCTILQAAAFLGTENAVRRLLEAGADPLKTVGAQSQQYQIAHLDASDLWEIVPARGPCKTLSAWKAQRAINSILGAAAPTPLEPK